MERPRIYGSWIALCAAMAVVAMLAPGRDARDPAPPGTPGMVHIRDAKLKRTVGLFDLEDPAITPRPMHEVNEPGVVIEIEIDPLTFDLMRVPGNRRRYLDRYTNVAYRIGGRDWRPGGVALRGAGTLTQSPDRVNFKLKFYRTEHPTPETRLRRVYLMAMIPDEHNVLNRFAYRVLGELGLFPLHNQYCRVVVNGVDQGMYMLVEPPVNGLRRVHESLAMVARRQKRNIYEIYFADDSMPRTTWSLRRLRSLNHRDDLSDAASSYARVLDLDSYLTYLAINSILLNSDQLDEVFFYEARARPDVPAPLRVLGWDFEDILLQPEKVPHVESPLLHSSQDILDEVIRREPALWAMYVRTLRSVMSRRMSPARLEQILDEVVAERDSINDGRPAAEQAEARSARAAFAAELRRAMRARSGKLAEALDAAP